ncbi:MAG: SPFH/Band 7/PHB domain protein [Anaerolineaceae bacterium]|nr:SPFH/Band 7/PHB domain protein [Anaerolineaceae bacterium]
MSDLLLIFPAAFGFFMFFLIAEPIFRFFLRLFGVYAIVKEGTAHVYTLFGNVVGVLEEPGLYFLWLKMGPSALLVNTLGKRHVLDMRLDQRYLRSLPVNSEEGAPMGIGIWYEMQISNPVAYLFKNSDPAGSLAANVSNATVRTLSNMPLDDMLETRHVMSRAVRAEVSPKSEEWGYRLGSVYIRKVHFRDRAMIQQIEEKVVNRLRQVTSAIRQDGANRVSIITNSAERRAAIEFAKAQAMRPQIVGEALSKINADPEVAQAMFEILETENMLKERTRITMIPKGNELMRQMIGAETSLYETGNGEAVTG